jgi:flagellar basal body rod protein FlgG
MQTMRHFEASQRFARTYDEMLDRAISDLGKV